MIPPRSIEVQDWETSPLLALNQQSRANQLPRNGAGRSGG